MKPLKPIQLFLFTFFIFTGIQVQAQLFVEVPRSGTPMVHSKAVWLSAGKKLHPIASGQVSGSGNQSRTILHQQRGSSFVASASGLPDVSLGGMDVGDFNKDGLQDVIITGIGNNGKRIAGIYLQQKNGGFIKSQHQIPALSDGSVQFGDYDKDGYLDVLICGIADNGQAQTIILRNNGNSLNPVQTPLPGIRFGKALWADFSNTGRLDVLLTGKTDHEIITRLFIQQNGNFVASSPHFTPLYHSDAVSADFDNDGLLDLMIAGQAKNGYPVTKYYLNRRNYQFIEGNNNGIRQLMNASLDAGDYDGDGFTDVVITGESLERPYTLVLKNIQGKGFKDMMAGLPGLANGTARWGDFDGDGDLDLYITGIDVCYNLVGSVYRCGLSSGHNLDIAESPLADVPIDFSRGPKYYFVFSSCYCDPENTGKKSYHGFVSNIHKEKKDYDLNYEFNHLLTTQFPGWNFADRGHRTSNAFTSISDAEKGRKTVIASYLEDNYTIHYLNW
ncbi:MAG: VCBS repeat-containing protein [Bacteroidales bacterium]|nr:VCBS repeat-containing protein [Bacteroidales bacterium]